MEGSPFLAVLWVLYLPEVSLLLYFPLFKLWVAIHLSFQVQLKCVFSRLPSAHIVQRLLPGCLRLTPDFPR